MLELDKSGPKATCSKVHIQGLMYQVLSYLKITTSDLEEHCFKVSLPLSFGDPLSVVHDLAGTLGLSSDLKVLSVLEHGH